MSPKDGTREPVHSVNFASDTQQYLRDMANGSFGLVNHSYRKTSDATKCAVRGIQESSYTAQVVDATKTVYNSAKDYGVVQWANYTVGAVAGATYTVGRGTIAASKQIYHLISPITEPTLRLTRSAVVNLAGATYGAGTQAYQVVAASSLTGPVVHFTGATIGSALAWNLMASSAASRAGRELARASCIRSSMWIFNSLHLPNSMRAAAVFTGTRAHNYIASGLVPGLFTAWAIYDGYRVARCCYDMYQSRNKEQLQQSDRFEESVQKWRNFYEDVAAQHCRIYYFGMYAPQ